MVNSDVTSIQSKVIVILAQVLGKENSSIVPTTLLEELGADSLDMFEIVMKLEEAFSLEISDDALARVKTVDDVVTLIASLKK